MYSLFTFFIIFASFSLAAQDCTTSAGTKSLYKPQQLVYTSPPAGYQPVFINHVGRHGARHLTKDVSTYLAYKFLMKADSLHYLTEAGERLKIMMETLRTIEAPFIKSISERGKIELEGIAKRMAGANETLIKKDRLGVNVEVTKEIRTSQSAEAFLNRLKKSNDSLKIKKTIDDTALRFYDLSPAYLDFEEKGKWKESLLTVQSALNMKIIFEDFTNKFFRKDFIKSSDEQEAFCKDIYGFASIVNSIRFETAQSGKHLADINFLSLFSCNQLIALSNVDEAEDFLLKGPGTDTMGIQVKIAVPLLVQFISATDEYMNGNGISLQLRFAHAETIAPLAALMQIKSASHPVGNIKTFNKDWKSAEIIPLSANIQWIFYQKKNSKDFLVKFLLNEKEVLIKGLSPKMYPFYDWTDVRKFYMGLLDKLNVELSDQMGAYLFNIN